MVILTLLKGAASSAARGAKWLWQPPRRKWVLGALTALLIAILIFRVLAHREEKKALEQAAAAARAETELVTRARTADTEAFTSNTEKKAAIAAKEAHGRRKTQEALDANPEWSNQSIPLDVINSLHD